MRKERPKCVRCGQPASIRLLEDVIDGYWTQFRLALCAACDESLRFCDLRAWEWFHEYATALAYENVLPKEHV
jgi:hypothetical protein